MYTAASPGNLLPKFSVPKAPPGPAGTIAQRASVLQKATGVAAAGYTAAGAHCVVGVAATPGPPHARATAPARTNNRTKCKREVIVSPFRTGSPRQRAAA